MSDDPVTPCRRTGHTPAGSLNPLRAEEGERSGSIQLKEKPLPSPPIEDHLPHGASLALLILALGLSVFLVALDNTIIATAIPKITDEFASLGDVGWYGSAYLQTTAATQLCFGKLYTFLPIKSVFVSAIGFFELGSVLCGAAPTSTILVLGRGIAGVGNAGIFSGALIIMANTIPLSKRPMYTGILAGMAGIASVAGPLLGGVLAEKLSWRWCFYINLPLGVVTLVMIIFRFQMPPTARAPPMPFLHRLSFLDPWGTLAFLPAVIALILALQLGGSKYAWSSGPIVALLVVAGVLSATFIVIQLRTPPDKSTIPPRILRQRTIWSSALYAFCMGAAFNIVTFYLPLWLQAIRGVSAVKSGILILPMIGAYVLGCILAGGLISITGFPAPAMILSGALAALGTGLLSTLRSSSSQTGPLPFEILTGLGVGIGMQQPILAAQAALEPKDIAVGTAVIMFSQTLGGALFVSVGQVTFTSVLVAQLVKMVPGVDPAVILSTGADSVKTVVGPAELKGVLFAYNQGLTRAFIVALVVAGVATVAACMVEWRSVKNKNIDHTSLA
ncbi:DHA14-like major facilitator [Mycena albidolilacea]|uniref:DHA14-like major facilitator n=1 Tax=Mycena albidolilacea TaxID=1033008 RepID=A0AAD7EAM0_9AGAR|nr:DHA14-like major facilitator [Mycena albidolilacea]